MPAISICIYTFFPCEDFCVHIRSRVNGFYWLRFYSASLLIERKSKQNALAPPLGASLSLGIPVIRHCCVGPPPPAIHGLRRLNRHPCRFAPRSNIEFRPAWFNGAPQIRIKSRSKTAVSPRNGRSELVRETSAQPKQASSDTPLRSLRQLLQIPSKPTQSGRLSGRRAFDFDLRRPVKPRWPNADSEAWVNRQGRRFSRTGPWMAHCGGPRFRICGRVCRATARYPVVGQERFAYFCASKVRRRKGATNISRD